MTAPGELGHELIAAIRRGNRGAVLTLLQRGADPNSVSDESFGRVCALDVAILRGHTEIVALLLDAGADPNGGKALTSAIRVGDYATARALLTRGANPDDQSDELPLCIAVRAVALNPIARLLLACGADVNAAFSVDALTPLFFAAGRHGSGAATRLLLDAGAEVNYRCADGDTALMWAAYQREWCEPEPENALIALLQAGADPNINNDQSGGVPTTALIWAAKEGRVGNVRILLDYGADPNLRDVNGETALLAAAAAGHSRIARELLERGADPRASDRQGRTAFDLAKRYCEQLLQIVSNTA